MTQQEYEETKTYEENGGTTTCTIHHYANGSTRFTLSYKNSISGLPGMVDLALFCIQSKIHHVKQKFIFDEFSYTGHLLGMPLPKPSYQRS